MGREVEPETCRALQLLLTELERNWTLLQLQLLAVGGWSCKATNNPRNERLMVLVQIAWAKERDSQTISNFQVEMLSIVGCSGALEIP